MFDELEQGVFRRHYDFLTLNVGVVIGDEGVLIVDSRESHEAAGELAADIRTLTAKPVRWVVNTHHHWDHVFGNAVFPDAAIWGHRRCRQRLIDDGDQGGLSARKWMPPDRHDEIDRVEIVAPTETFEAIARVDLGNHIVELAAHGRGHTDNDIVVHVGAVTYMGDLVEDAGAPAMGDGYLLDWPVTLAVIEPEAGEIIVPGHGQVQDHDWLFAQRADMEQVAARLRDVLYAGRPLDDAVTAGPFDEGAMREALTRGVAWALAG